MSPLVATVLDLTDQVQAAIDGGDWPRAQELETERRRVLEQLAVAAETPALSSRRSQRSKRATTA